MANPTLCGEKNVHNVLIIYPFGRLVQEQFGLINGVTNIDASRGYKPLAFRLTLLR